MLKKVLIIVTSLILLFYLGEIITGNTIVLCVSKPTYQIKSSTNDSIVNLFESFDFEDGKWDVYLVIGQEDKKSALLNKKRANCLHSTDDELFATIKSDWRFKLTEGDISTVESRVYLIKDGVLMFESGIVLDKNIEGLQNRQYGWKHKTNVSQMLFSILNECIYLSL